MSKLDAAITVMALFAGASYLSALVLGAFIRWATR